MRLGACWPLLFLLPGGLWSALRMEKENCPENGERERESRDSWFQWFVMPFTTMIFSSYAQISLEFCKLKHFHFAEKNSNKFSLVYN